MSAASKVENDCDIKSSGTLHSRLPLTKDSIMPVVLRGDVISLAPYLIYLQLPSVSQGHLQRNPKTHYAQAVC